MARADRAPRGSTDLCKTHASVTLTLDSVATPSSFGIQA